ncbi:hypothetical protein [Streptomyces sp. NPDC052042]|uniref:hypothetical protein n=1 Tax=Streptomyces sp. NPDC052042 TaxID=3365683 RepID=UPI0037D21EA6
MSTPEEQPSIKDALAASKEMAAALDKNPALDDPMEWAQIWKRPRKPKSKTEKKGSDMPRGTASASCRGADPLGMNSRRLRVSHPYAAPPAARAEAAPIPPVSRAARAWSRFSHRD